MIVLVVFSTLLSDPKVLWNHALADVGAGEAELSVKRKFFLNYNTIEPGKVIVPFQGFNQLARNILRTDKSS